ncbi:MAG: sulfite exporter TauE/SafE family protein [Bacteroidia bacterium]
MDQSFWNIIILIIAGGLGGFMAGLLGVGGGLIFVPILDYFLIKKGVSSHDLVAYTLANSFLAILVSGSVGSWAAFKSKSINITHLFVVGISAVFSILITSWLINTGTWYSPTVFKIFFCILLLLTLIKTMLHIEHDGTSYKMNMGLGLFTGLLTGAVSGLSGLGGGLVMVPLFTMLGKMNMRKAATLSLAIIPILALPNVIYYMVHQPMQKIADSTGHIVWPIVIPVIIGVLITVNAGVNAANSMSPKTIKYIFAAFIIITITRIFMSLQ